VKPTDFQPGSPGELVATAFQIQRDGQPESIQGHAFVPVPLPPKIERDSLVGRLHDVLDRAKTNLLRVEAAVQSLPDPNFLLRAMRTREAQASSNIENTVASLAEIALAEVGDGAERNEAVEVLNNRRAIEAGLASALPISARLLCDLHRVLLNRGRGEDMRPGRFRDRQVYIGDPSRGFEHARFVPPPAGDILTRCIKDWELFVNPGSLEAPRRERWPYLIELALAHYQFETIHPFADGNGRLGRALVNIAPVKDRVLKYPVCNLSEWVESRRAEYYERLLRVSTHAEWEEWISFFCMALAGQAASDLARADRVCMLRERYRERFTTKRNSALLMKLIDMVFEQPAVSIPKVADYLRITYPSAQKHIELFVKEGILSLAEKGMKYGKIYLARPVIRAVQGRSRD
jgi:Fic family protein